MRLLLPPGKRAGQYLLTTFCFLVFAALGMANGQTPETGARLRALNSSKLTATATGNTSSNSNCLSVSEVSDRIIAGKLSPTANVNLCQDTKANDRSSLSASQANLDAQSLVIEPTPSDTTSATGSGGFSGFLLPTSYPTMTSTASSNPTKVTVAADFLKHGYKDLLTIDSLSVPKIHLMANNGDGTFAAPVDSSAGYPSSYYTPYISAIAYDYDKDGYPDLLARDASNYVIAFFHNNQDGTFTRAKNIKLPACYYAAAMLIGDVTGDNVDDLIVFVTTYNYSTSSTTMQVLVYSGTGTGDFNTTASETDYVFAGAKVIIPNRGALLGTNMGRKSLYVEALSMGSYGTYGATVFALGLNGDGTFMESPYAQQDFPTASIYANTNNGGLSLADLNGDGIPDITMNFYDGYIYTALGAADGSFPVVNDAGLGFLVYPESWNMKDVDGDGYPDLIVKEYSTVEVLPGLGNGKFGPATKYYTTSTSNSAGSNNSPAFNMVYDDFNGDGIDDAVYVDTSYNGYNRAVVLLGEGAGNFRGPVALPSYNQLGYSPGKLYGEAMFDTNGDGRSDLILYDTNGSSSYYLRTALSDGKGGFNLIKALAPAYGTHQIGRVKATYDFNGDGRKDLVVDSAILIKTSTYNHSLAVALSKGDGTFGTPVFLDTNGAVIYNALMSVAVGDINGDGVADIVGVTIGGSYDTPRLLTFLGNSDGTFQPAVIQTFGTAYSYAGLALADFNGDGKLDLFISDDGKSSVTPKSYIIFGDNSGSFDTSKAVVFTSGISLRKALIADLNGDGKVDIAVISGGVMSGSTVTTTNRGLLVYLNNGDGTFTTTGNIYESGALGSTGLLADLNGDGKLDLVFAVDYPWDRDSASNAGLQLLLGNGDGTFGTPENLTVPPSVSMLAAGDLDGDGALDLMSFSYYVGSVAVIRNISGSTVSLTADATTITRGNGVTFTATVAPTVDHRPNPTGAVKFLHNGATLGTTELQAGTASLFVDSLPVGTDAVQAVYLGDSSFSANLTGASTAVTVTAPATVTPDFSFNATNSSLSIPSGSTGALSFSLASNSSFSGTLQLTVSGLPTGMSASFSPSTVSLSPSSSAAVTMTVNTVTAKNGTAAVARAFTLATPIFGAVLCLAGFRRRRLARSLWVVALLGTIAGLMMLAGCGSSSKYQTTMKGKYVLVVQATPSVAGAATKAFNVTVHVN